MRVPAWLQRSLFTIAGLSFAFVAVMGFAHTKPGRPLLAVIGPVFGMKPAHTGTGRCPFGFDVRADGAEKDAATARFSALHRGEVPAASRPALGFSLGKSTRADIDAWAAAHQIRCTTPRVGADLDCSKIASRDLPDPSRGGPDLTDLWFNFASDGRLGAVIAFRKERDAGPIEAAYQASDAELTRAAGVHAQRTGDPRPGYLAGGLLRQTSVEYRFSDYYAVLRASNMGDGFLLIEEYRALANPALAARTN